MTDKIMNFVCPVLCTLLLMVVAWATYVLIASASGHVESIATKNAVVWAEKNNVKLISVACVNSNNVLEADCEINTGNEFIYLVCSTNNCIKKVNNKVIENNMTCESK